MNLPKNLNSTIGNKKNRTIRGNTFEIKKTDKIIIEDSRNIFKSNLSVPWNNNNENNSNEKKKPIIKQNLNVNKNTGFYSQTNNHINLSPVKLRPEFFNSFGDKQDLKKMNIYKKQNLLMKNNIQIIKLDDNKPNISEVDKNIPLNIIPKTKFGETMNYKLNKETLSPKKNNSFQYSEPIVSSAELLKKFNGTTYCKYLDDEKHSKIFNDKINRIQKNQKRIDNYVNKEEIIRNDLQNTSKGGKKCICFQTQKNDNKYM
jgi:hypothetical protein